MMTGPTIRIGGDGPVAVESDAAGWRLIVHGKVEATGTDDDALHEALRVLAVSHGDIAEDAFGIVCNCADSWEDEYTEEHGEDALSFGDWMEHVNQGTQPDSPAWD